jgi:HNH endonuclease
MLHKHHIIPRHAGGSNDPSNLKMLTVEEHVAAHKELFEKYGRWQDNLAVRFLTGITSKKEAVAESLAMGGRIVGSRPKSELHRKRIGQSKIGKPRPWTAAWRSKIPVFVGGIPKEKFLCSCGKIADKGNLTRWHSNHEIVSKVM